MLIGVWVCRQYHFRGATKMLQRDTIVRYDTIRYTRLQLAEKTYELDLPRLGNIYIPKDSVRIEYRDTGKTQYIVLPRKAYHTQMKDLEIWHSGVESRIDSVQSYHASTTIKETIRQKEWNHEISIFASIGYDKTMRIPLGAEYTYYPLRWIGIGARAEYDFNSKSVGVYAKANIRIGWNK